MFLKRDGDESLQPKGNEDSAQLQQMLTSCMINRQILVRHTIPSSCVALLSDSFVVSCLQCCIAGVLIGIPISIQRKSYKPFAILGVLGAPRKAVDPV
jgi:hypothetical protein